MTRWNRNWNTKATHEWRRGAAWICVVPKGNGTELQIRDAHDDVDFHATFKTKFAALEFAHVHMRNSR